MESSASPIDADELHLVHGTPPPEPPTRPMAGLHHGTLPSRQDSSFVSHSGSNLSTLCEAPRSTSNRMTSINDLATAAIASSTPAESQVGVGNGTRGAFIVLEGLDRSGKTTQVKLLEQRFVEEGRSVKTMRFPNRTTPIGHMIDAYLNSHVQMEDHVIHLLFSANRWEAVEQIKSLLASGTTIICDRFYHSGIVYSAAKMNPSLSLSWARAPERGLPRPDMVLFLDLDEETAKARGGWGGEVYEKAEMQKRVRELFWGLSMGGKDTQGQEMLADLGGLDGAQWRQEEEDLVVVDAGGSAEEVAERVWGKVKGRVDLVARGEIGRTVRIVR